MIVAFAFALLGAILPWPLVRWACFTLAFFLAASWGWSKLLGRFLIVKTETAHERAFSGQSIDVRYRLENRTPLPAGMVFVTDSAGNLETSGVLRHFVSPAPFSLLRFAYAFRGHERGRVGLGPFTVHGGDPALLFPYRRIQNSDDRSVVIYPPLRGDVKLSDEGMPPGSRRDDRFWAEDVSRFRSYREFREGDELSRLVASASSQAGSPVVRTFDRTRALPTLVFVDLRLETFPLRHRWSLVDRVLETAATLIWDLLQVGETVWLSVVGHRAEGEQRWGPGKSPASAVVFLETLALLRPLEDGKADWDEASWWGTLPSPPLRVFRLLPHLDGRSREPLPSWARRWRVIDVEL